MSREKSLAPSQTPNTPLMFRSTQHLGAKFQEQKENKPDLQLRSQIVRLVGKEVSFLRHLGGRLRSSHPLKKA